MRAFSFANATATVTVTACALASFVIACGGEGPPPSSPANASASASTQATTPSSMQPATSPDHAAQEPEVHASIVRFDDIRVRFTVPAGYRVLGDDELAARVRSSADLRLNQSLRAHASDKRGLPLLSLEKQTSSADDFLTVSLAVVLVPGDARAMELAAQQQGVMAEHLTGFAVTEAATPKNVSGVDGAEIGMRYEVKRAGNVARAASLMRVFVREGLATMAVAVWPESQPARGEEARLVLDGLAFD